MEMEDCDEWEESGDWDHKESGREGKKDRKLVKKIGYSRERLENFEREYGIPGNHRRDDHWGENYDEQKSKMAKKMRRMEKEIENSKVDLEAEKKRRRAAEEALENEKKAIPAKVEAAMVKERRQFEQIINEKDALLRMATAQVKKLEGGNPVAEPTNEAMLQMLVEVQVVRTSNRVLEKKMEEMDNQMKAKEDDWDWEREELRTKLAIYESQAEAATKGVIEARIPMPTQEATATRRRQPRGPGAVQQISGGAAPQSGSPSQARRRRSAGSPGPSGAVQEVLQVPVPPARRHQSASGPESSDATESAVRRQARKRACPNKLTF